MMNEIELIERREIDIESTESGRLAARLLATTVN